MSKSSAAVSADHPPLQIEGRQLLVVSPQDITEACFSVPAVRALHHGRPGASLAVLAPESIAPLWQTVSGIDPVISFPDRASHKDIFQQVRDSGFTPDSALVWEDAEATRAIAKLRPPQILGYDSKALTKRLTHKLTPDVPEGPPVHRVRHYMGLLERLGLEAYVPRNFATPPLPPRPDPPRIGLVPGSTLGTSYRWPVERFHQLGEALLAHHQVELVILSFPGLASGASELDAGPRGAQRHHLRWP